MFSLMLQESSISILRDLKFGLIYLILNQPNVCFCCRYIMSKGKLKKTAFPIHPNLPGPGVSSSSRDARSKGANWSRLMEKYNLDMLKSHIMKATRKASINENRKVEYWHSRANWWWNGLSVNYIGEVWLGWVGWPFPNLVISLK